MRNTELYALLMTFTGVGVSGCGIAALTPNAPVAETSVSEMKLKTFAEFWFPSTPPTAQPQPVRSAVGIEDRLSRIVPFVVGWPGVTSG